VCVPAQRPAKKLEPCPCLPGKPANPLTFEIFSPRQFSTRIAKSSRYDFSVINARTHRRLERPSAPPFRVLPRRCHAVVPGLPDEGGFTLMELLVVMGIIAMAMAFLIPSLSPSSGRSVDAAAGQLKADLEQARLTALAERTRTRVLLPVSSANFSNVSGGTTAWPTEITRRGYLVVSEKRTDSRWSQRGKWNRFPTGVGLNSASVLPTPSATPMEIDVTGTGTKTTYTFNGPYIEFLANGSSNLDPSASPIPTAVIADGFVDANDGFVPKNQKLKYTVSVDPLTGAVTSK
jgi:prepilin-type N-terminal cleavage/methylation domain-containing protein